MTHKIHFGLDLDRGFVASDFGDGGFVWLMWGARE